MKKVFFACFVCLVVLLITPAWGDTDYRNATCFDIGFGPQIYNYTIVYLADENIELPKAERDTIWFLYNSNSDNQLIADLDSIGLDGYVLINDQTSPNGSTFWMASYYIGSELDPAKTGWDFTLFSPEGDDIWTYNTVRDGPYGQGFLDLPKGLYTWQLSGHRGEHASAVPEPTSLMAFGMGLSLLAGSRFIRFRK